MLGPFESWLLLRGMRTLYPRVRTASANALDVARYFEGIPASRRCCIPASRAIPSTISPAAR